MVSVQYSTLVGSCNCILHVFLSDNRLLTSEKSEMAHFCDCFHKSQGIKRLSPQLNSLLLCAVLHGRENFLGFGYLL